MAKKTTAALPPTPETREAVLHAIGGSDQPLTTSQLAKLLAAPHKLSAAVLDQMLNEYVTAGTLHLIASAKEQGKPQYWDRDVNALGRAAVLDVAQRAECPLTAKELSRQLETPLKFAEIALTVFLNEHVAAGRLHSIPPKTTKGGTRYWGSRSRTIRTRVDCGTVRPERFAVEDRPQKRDQRTECDGI